jgi:AmmeMemoRadiSam system protein B
LEAIFEKTSGLEEDGARPDGRLCGMVAPHIDLRVGGPCGALAFGLIAESSRVETVFVLGTAHGCPHPAWLVLPKPYETSMGPVPVDEDACRRLMETVEQSPEGLFHHRKEHSVEFQAVFLSYLRHKGQDLKMVPVLCGSLRELGDGGEHPGDDPFLTELGRILEERGESAVVVAGADLAHVGPRFGDRNPLDQHHLELLEAKDRDTLTSVTRGDASDFYGAVTKGGDPRRICGLSPIYGALASLPEVRGKVLRYEQAIEPTGTVTYASVGLWA